MRHIIQYLLLSVLFSIAQSHAVEAVSPIAVQRYQTNAKQAILFDYDTGQILFAHNADQLMHPSSMTKTMTTYIVFSALKDGILSLDDKFTVSEKAWQMSGSKMFLQNGENVTVDNLIKGVIVQSGNDACVVLAEGMFGDETVFVQHMNAIAEKLGMKQTHFVNSSGWPDPIHLTTARDLGRLARAMIKEFPEYYHYHAVGSFTYSNITQRNRNAMLGKLGVDGIKTGHTEAGGYGIILSNMNGDRRMIAVINGLASEKARLQEGERILTYGYAFKKAILFSNVNHIATAQVLYGSTPNVYLTVASDAHILTQQLYQENIKCKVKYNDYIKAPIYKGTKLGVVECSIPNINDDQTSFDLVATDDVQKANFVQHIWQNIENWIAGTN